MRRWHVLPDDNERVAAADLDGVQLLERAN
jgi:hypothetical protein